MPIQNVQVFLFVLGCVLVPFIAWFPYGHLGSVTEIVSGDYDFIIVGSGSAGSVIAARLSEHNFRVALLEAGDEENVYEPAVKIPAYGTSHVNSDGDWQTSTVPQKHCCGSMHENKTKLSRGKMLGGSSSMTFGAYVRGSTHDFNQWATSGCEGWKYDDVLPYFIKMEAVQDEEIKHPVFRGTKGPIGVTMAHKKDTKMYTVMKNMAEELGMEFVDHNLASNIGATVGQRNIMNGVRQSTVHSYIRPALRKSNLDVVTSAFVTKILFNGKTAVGVQYAKKGELYEVRAHHEVILSAGTLGSPQILMLSGIGPRQHLHKLGIEVIADLPVGANLHDHVWLPVNQMRLRDREVPTRTQDLGLTLRIMYTLLGTGQLTRLAGEAAVHARSSTQRHDDMSTAIQVIGHHSLLGHDPATLQMLRKSYNVKKHVLEALFGNQTGQYGYNWFPVLTLPHSRGEVKLKSVDPFEPPEVNPNYISDKRDVEILLEGVRLGQKMMRSRAMKQLGVREIQNVHPSCKKFKYDSDNYWRCFIREMPFSSWHPVGTCKMGSPKDTTAVVDPMLRVRGVKSLRVADASIMPRITSGDTNAPTMMIGEKMADHVIRTAKGVRAAQAALELFTWIISLIWETMSAYLTNFV